VGASTSAADPAALVARPIAAPPSANPSAATVDLFYEIANASGALRPGQSVSAALPLRAEAESLVVPWSAVVHDIHGGTWVYEALGARAYARRRVQVRHVVAGHVGGDPQTPGPAGHVGGDPQTPGPAGHVGGDPQTPGPAGTAVLASGPKPGAAVVTEGAAELFGAEFGTGK